MKILHCVFCGCEVAAPDQLNDPTARAICNDCIARGGRLPRMGGARPYQIHVDDQGRAFRPRWQQSRWWRQVRAYLIPNPLVATIYTVPLLVIAFVVLAMVFKAPLQSLAFWGFCTLVWWGWRAAMHRGWL